MFFEWKQWRGDNSRLELISDGYADQLRVKHPVRIPSDEIKEQPQAAFTHTLNPENTTQSAAIDVGANNTLALVTEDGDTAVSHTRPEFERFQTQSERIATLQSQLPTDQWTSTRIKRIFDILLRVNAEESSRFTAGRNSMLPIPSGLAGSQPANWGTAAPLFFDVVTYPGRLRTRTVSLLLRLYLSELVEELFGGGVALVV